MGMSLPFHINAICTSAGELAQLTGRGQVAIYGRKGASSVNRDTDDFFVHPAFKEWLRSLPEQFNKPFKPLAIGVVGDLKPYEAKPPLVRVGVADGAITLKLRTARTRSTMAGKGTAPEFSFGCCTNVGSSGGSMSI
ncbi:MAG: hypothetical protein M3Y65_06730 [Pseudomonadota bacterium]|nr:hypothetical protein [Pseudomonadota bacterium]